MPLHVNTFEPIACGETLPPNNVHAVSVSIPNFSDVIDYGEKRESPIKSGYPRFVMHPYLKEMATFLRTKYDLHEMDEIILVSSWRFSFLICEKFSIAHQDFDEEFGIIIVPKDSSVLADVLLYIQHVGCNISSRYAEAYLYQNGVINSLQEEERAPESSAKETILQTLAKAYDEKVENITLAPSGMNAIYAAIKGVQEVKKGKKTLIQLGWLYRDTMGIVKDHSLESKTFYDVSDLDALEAYLKDAGHKALCLITEVPTNPLIQCADLPRLKALCDQYAIALIIDSTIGCALNIDLKPYADIYVESLTKFACGKADVMMGALIINGESPLVRNKMQFFMHRDAPCILDLQRLAVEITGYEERMKKINTNTATLVEYLQGKPYIKEIFHTLHPSNKGYYKQLMRDENAVGGLISLTFTKDFAMVYDTLNFPKGPSLGTEFTLAMAYVHLAHYKMTQEEEGQELLRQNHIPVDLLRISVGTEPIEAIIAEFEKLERV